MCHPTEYVPRDELRATFTRWLEVVVRNAQRDFLRKKRRSSPSVVSLESIDESLLAIEPDMLRALDGSADSFSFEEERLAAAYRELPLMRRRILEMLFISELQPVEIAVRLHCSVQHVYNQRSLALKRLRELLSKEGD